MVFRKYVWAPVAGAFFALCAAGVAGLIGKKALLDRMVAPIQDLLTAAVSAANGNLDVHANESAPGELGELGQAINNLSMQLAENMYTLILERNRLKHMIDGLSEGIVAVDREKNITHANPALEKLFTKQKPGQHWPDPRMSVIPDQTIWNDFDRVIASGESVTRNFEMRDMTLRLTITPIVDELGATAGAVGLISDITQSERLERTRREYVSNVSHELRTPLTAMRALVEPLKEGMVTDEADRMRYYDIILREVMRLSRLINDQLELSRLQSGTIAIEKTRMALDDLVYDVCDRYGSIAREHNLELLGSFLGHGLAQRGGSVVDQILGFLQAQTGLDFADDLDDLQFLCACFLQHNVELGLLFNFLCGSRCCATGNHGCCRGYAELLFHFLNQVCQLQNRHALDCGDDFCIAHDDILLTDYF